MGLAPPPTPFVDDFTMWGGVDPTKDDLLNYYKMDANVGGLIIDEQGNQDLTIVGTPSFPTTPSLIPGQGHYYGPAAEKIP